MNIQKLKNLGRNKLLKCNIEDAVFKADILLQYTLNMTKTEIIINCENEVSNEIYEKYIQYIDEIIQGKPIQYITNKQEFMKLNFYVNENVLIPQPDTETLVEGVIKKINTETKIFNKKVKILDLCTGSGAIAISLEYYLKNKYDIKIFASDVSEDAINIAKRNAKENNAKIEFIISNMFENIKEENLDIIVSNPPYIESSIITTLPKEVQSEPHLALDGGTDGLDFYRTIANEAYKHVKSGGYILVEIGYNQKEKVIHIFKEYDSKYFDIKCIKDLNGQDRVIEIKRR